LEWINLNLVGPFFKNKIKNQKSKIGAPLSMMDEFMYSDRGDFWAYSVEILVFASPTGYMLTSSGFLCIDSGYIL
jgi:hypothetical protein